MSVFVTILVITACLELHSVSCQSDSMIDVPCEDQQEACVCDENYKICRFRLEVEELQTFTSYRISKEGQIVTRGTPGDTYYLDQDGFKLSLDNDFCARERPPPECGQCRRTGGVAIPATEIETFRNGLNEINNCSIPTTVDGSTYRLFIAVNGRIPGPTLVATEGQEIIVEVYNSLTSEGITIHWHGLHQKGTPWMDGVASLSHIPIVPGGHFQYRFKATPAGTHWYHSHLGAQRTDGLFGGLIIREHPSNKSKIAAALNLGEITDVPEEHTLTLLDWQRESSLNLFVQIHSTLGFYPDKPLGEVPRNYSDRLYNRTSSSDDIEVGPVPFFSGLINGRGRYTDTTYSILSVFNIDPRQKYRFRLIGAQSLYAFRFEIDGHKLNVIATDGHFIVPTLVDYIIIHSGERYDFIPQLMSNVPSTPMNYRIRATTLERDITADDRPFHAAEAILHYEGAAIPDMTTFYSNVYITDHTTRCNSDPCIALNCPFKDYPPIENIHCTNVDELEALFPKDDSQLPTLHVKTLFFNFGFEGQSSTSAINGINFLPPATPYQTYPGQYNRDVEDVSKNTCQDCTPDTNISPEDLASKCTCTKVEPIFQSEQLDDSSDKSIVMVFSAVGANRNRDFAHPIHLHGHSFYVVHIGYGNYNEDGRLLENSPDISCKGDQYCRNPSWQGEMPPEILGYTRVNKSAILKDTVLLPAGGYVVIAFLADNPGYWFLHCHIEVHQLEGMAVIIKEYDETEHPSPPLGINIVGDYTPRPVPAVTDPASTKSAANNLKKIWEIIIVFIVFTITIFV